MSKQKKSLTERRKAELFQILRDQNEVLEIEDRVLLLVEQRFNGGKTFPAGTLCQLTNVEGGEFHLIPESELKEEQPCGLWCYTNMFIPYKMYHELLKLMLQGRLREACLPLADKGTECIINDHEYIEVNNVLYLHADYFFELI